MPIKAFHGVCMVLCSKCCANEDKIIADVVWPEKQDTRLHVALRRVDVGSHGLRRHPLDRNASSELHSQLQNVTLNRMILNVTNLSICYLFTTKLYCVFVSRLTKLIIGRKRPVR